LSRRTRRTTRGGGQREEEEDEEEEEEDEEDQATDIKSNNPHLAGGEKTSKRNPSPPGVGWGSIFWSMLHHSALVFLRSSGIW